MASRLDTSMLQRSLSPQSETDEAFTIATPMHPVLDKEPRPKTGGRQTLRSILTSDNGLKPKSSELNHHRRLPAEHAELRVKNAKYEAIDVNFSTLDAMVMNQKLRRDSIQSQLSSYDGRHPKRNSQT